jgi:lysophospholipase L1-like esterase
MDIIFFGDSLTEGIPGISYFDILREKLPQHSLFNCGKGGDTVISLLRRVRKMDISKSYDIAVIWVGVNDVLVHVSFKYPIIKEVLHQPWVKDIKEFVDHYFELINTVSSHAKKTFTVSPLLIGEDINNKWNEQLGEISKEIELLSMKFKNVEYVDIRKEFFSKLSSKETSSFIVNRSFWDFIRAGLLKNLNYVEEISEKRGLYYTFDGVHFNHRGAQMVADKFLRCIENEIRKSS